MIKHCVPLGQVVFKWEQVKTKIYLPLWASGFQVFSLPWQVALLLLFTSSAAVFHYYDYLFFDTLPYQIPRKNFKNTMNIHHLKDYK